MYLFQLQKKNILFQVLGLYKSMLSKCEEDGFNKWEKEYVSYFQWIYSNGVSLSSFSFHMFKYTRVNVGVETKDNWKKCHYYLLRISNKEPWSSLSGFYSTFISLVTCGLYIYLKGHIYLNKVSLSILIL